MCVHKLHLYVYHSVLNYSTFCFIRKQHISVTIITSMLSFYSDH